MATVTEIRAAIGRTLNARIPDLMVYPTVPDVTQVPAVVVWPDTADFTGTFSRGWDSWSIDLYVLASRVESDLGQDVLDAYVTGSGETSIRELVFEVDDFGLDDGTTAIITGLRGYGGEFATAGVPHVGAILRLVVHTPGTH